MLEELHVKDLALIEEAWLEFGPGMTVLTGETGAGKTALLGALKLLMGERGDSGAVRAGATEALVEGRFTAAGAEVLARRRVGADGRSRCFLDGQMATVGTLAECIGPLVDLHGQHEHQALLSASTHVGYLDRKAGEPAAAALQLYRSARDDYRIAVEERDGLEARRVEAARNADYLRFVVDEIDRVDPKPGEDEELEARLPALQHGERLAKCAAEAAVELRGDGGAMDRAARAAELLGRMAGIDPALDELAQRATEASGVLDDLGSELRAYRDRVEHDPAALDEVLQRLGELAGVTRKYGPRLADVLARRDEARAVLAESELGEDASRRAEERVIAARETFTLTAEQLTAVRLSATPGFVEALTEAVHELAMEGSRFEVGITELPFDGWTAEGAERVEFLYAPAPDQPARPLVRIASGGEISRVMLALKGVLGDADAVETLVFDEVDAGIGGATARTVGARLAHVARSHQVIVVTHLAQVAAFADAHLVVRKSVSADTVATTVARVEGEARVGEIARMLSGHGSDAGSAHARELIEDAKTHM